MGLGEKLSNPSVYRALFVIGFFVFGVGAIMVNLIITGLGVIVVALSKIGMRIEHKEKLKHEIYSSGKETIKP